MHYKNPMQVFFIIHPGTLGDVVLAFPAIQAIRRRFFDHRQCETGIGVNC